MNKRAREKRLKRIEARKLEELKSYCRAGLKYFIILQLRKYY